MSSSSSGASSWAASPDGSGSSCWDQAGAGPRRQARQEGRDEDPGAVAGHGAPPAAPPAVASVSTSGGGSE